MIATYPNLKLIQLTIRNYLKFQDVSLNWQPHGLSLVLVLRFVKILLVFLLSGHLITFLNKRFIFIFYINGVN
jgi:hypothetical protein